MTNTGIECFLAICRYKTGSAAAQALYITQPSLSARLRVLEREVGVPLFYRTKGSREMILTEKGKEFYQLAVQYESLIKKMKKLGDSRETTLRIACFNSLATYLLPPVYELFSQSNPQIALQMQDTEMPLSGQNILQGKTDLAFTTVSSSDSQLWQVPVFSEPMVLICAADSQLQSPVSLSDLSLRDEVYVGWCREFIRWHQKVLGSPRSHFHVSIMSQLRHFLEQEGRWAIVPVSVAKGLAAECGIRQLEIDAALPRREVSYVIGAQSPSAALDAFLECLQQVLAACPEFEVYL